jgi:hypothetical protein
MRINVEKWSEFRFGDLIKDEDIYKAKAINKIDLTETLDLSKAIRYITRTSTNNGCELLAKKDEINTSNIEEGNAITVGDTTATCFYQQNEFITGDHMVVIRATWMNELRGLFIVSLMQKEQYKYSYGRAFLIDKIKDTIVKLPSKLDADGKLVPNWTEVEQIVKKLHYKPITTSKKNTTKQNIDASDWKEFTLHKILKAEMGNGIDAIKTTSDNPKYNYVSRDSNGNGVVAVVDEIEVENPFPKGALSLALGGSFLGSCFIQLKPFYTAQNVAVLQEREPLSIYTKLFISTLIRNECKVKYQAFGRELNSHFRKDFTIKLPVKKNSSGYVIDKRRFYSDEGFIPDWEWMDNYMKSLPYSDRIN